jgi:prepilin-type N-terminal cleavage/methylation domain-containing protein
MKKQSGFTLIELLLVLAIIGIISAIAIPALLGQRARARDKAAMSNLDGIIADGIGQWDKYREQGASPTAAMTSVASYIKAGHTKDVNPWNGTSTAYASMTIAAGGVATVSAFMGTTMATAGSLGQVKLFGQPSTASLPGFLGGAVLLHGVTNGSINYRKAAAVE